VSGDADQSEDCLTLDVFTPPTEQHTGAHDTPLPVFFFIHGGMNTQGSTASYGPIERLVPRLGALGQPHVVIAVNYRLGARSRAFSNPGLATRC
jgi:carboxylesterase type B